MEKYFNREKYYRRPDFEDVMREVEELPTVTQKINHLRRVLVDDAQKRDIIIEDKYEGAKYTENSIRITTAVTDPENKRRFEKKTEQFRRKIKREIAFLEEQLPEDIVTRRELEEGISDDRLAAALGHTGESRKGRRRNRRVQHLKEEEKRVEPFIWVKSERLLAYLLEILFSLNYILPGEKKWVQVASFFVKPGGGSYDHKQLARARKAGMNNKDQKPKGAEELGKAICGEKI